MDATVGKMPGTINKLYCAVALFSDNDVRFSIDVSSGGPNGADRDQYEVKFYVIVLSNFLFEGYIM